jgi:hypothetical protein
MKQSLVLKLGSNADIEHGLNRQVHTVRGNNLVACSWVMAPDRMMQHFAMSHRKLILKDSVAKPFLTQGAAWNESSLNA